MIASLALLILSPLWLLIALLIKLDSRGPVFYKQERVGMDGRVFLFYKFRTMRAGTDDVEHREFQKRYIGGQPDSNLGNDQRPAYKLRADDRVTRLGRIQICSPVWNIFSLFQPLMIRPMNECPLWASGEPKFAGASMSRCLIGVLVGA